MLNTAKTEKYKRKWMKYIGYEPHKGQAQLHFPKKPNARFTVAVCGRRWGKSMAAAVEAQIMLQIPNTETWCVAPTYDGSERVFSEVWKAIMVKGQFEQNGFIKRASYKDQLIQTEWNSTFKGKSADKPQTLVGAGLNLLIIDEAAKIKRKTWETYLRPTLADKKGNALFITTPEGYNYVWELFNRGQSDELWYSFNSPSWQNHYAFPDGKYDVDLLEAKRNSTAETFDQEFGGKFTTFAGRVYPFDRNLDVGNFSYSRNLPTYCSIDFGYRMPAVIWAQRWKSGGIEHVNIIDEFIHKTNIKTEELCNKIKSKSHPTVSYYGDPAGYNTSGQTGLGDIEIFRRNGVHIRTIRDKVSRKITSGVEHTRSFIESGAGIRRLHLNEKCKGLMEDLESYRYPEHLEGRDLKPEPLKDGYCDHGCDALRYLLLNLFPIKQRKFRTIRKK